MRSSRVEMVGGPVLAALQRGASVKAAAGECQIAEQTLRSWIRRRRDAPDGPFGPFARVFDGRHNRTPTLAAVEGRAGVADRQELLELLAEVAGNGSVRAIELLLRELPPEAAANTQARARELVKLALAPLSS
jgi:transposase-like protein